MTATATATIERTNEATDASRRELLLGESVQSDEFTATLWSIGSASCVNVSCPDWMEQFMVDSVHGWIKNEAGKVLAYIAIFPPQQGKIMSIQVLRWAEFLTALRVLHKPKAKK